MPYTLITGASGGLGEQFAYLAASDGNNLILTARSADKLEALSSVLAQKYGVQVKVFALDLGAEGAAGELYNKIKNASLAVNCLINNAGFGTYGEFKDSDFERQSEMIRLNVLALTQLCRLFGADMAVGSGGKIMNVSSVAALIPGPFMATYYATKAYVLSFSQSLNAELKKCGVTITAVCPGPTDTNFKATANVGSPKMFSRMMTSEKVAKIGYKAMKKGKAVKYVGFVTKFAALASRMFSRRLCTAVCKKINGERKV